VIWIGHFSLIQERRNRWQHDQMPRPLSHAACPDCIDRSTRIECVMLCYGPSVNEDVVPVRDGRSELIVQGESRCSRRRALGA
jgi:hypothetical protein